MPAASSSECHLWLQVTKGPAVRAVAWTRAPEARDPAVSTRTSASWAPLTPASQVLASCQRRPARPSVPLAPQRVCVCALPRGALSGLGSPLRVHVQMVAAPRCPAEETSSLPAQLHSCSDLSAFSPPPCPQLRVRRPPRHRHREERRPLRAPCSPGAAVGRPLLRRARVRGSLVQTLWCLTTHSEREGRTSWEGWPRSTGESTLYPRREN